MRKLIMLLALFSIGYSAVCLVIWGIFLGWIVFNKTTFPFWEPGITDWGMFSHSLIPAIFLATSVSILVLSRKKIKIAVLIVIMMFIGYAISFHFEIRRNYYAHEEYFLHPNWWLYSCFKNSNQPLIHGYVDQKGQIIIKPQFQSGFDFHEGSAVVRISGKYGYINKSGDLVIKPTFDEALSFSEGLAVVGLNNRYGYINTTGELEIPALWEGAGSFSEGLAAIISEGKVGFIDKKGNTIITPKYNRVEKFSNGLALVVYNSTYGFIDKDGNMLDIGGLSLLDAKSFSEKLAAIEFPNAEYRWGYIEPAGKVVIPPAFMSASMFSNGFAFVRLADKQVFIDRKGTIAFKIQPGNPNSFSEGLARISWDNKKWEYHRKYIHTYIDKNGKEVFHNNFVRSYDFYDGLARFMTREGKWGYLDPNGKEVIPPCYERAFDFSEGLACVAIASKK